MKASLDPSRSLVHINGTGEAELKAVVDAIEAYGAYEAKRWPLGKDPNVPGGKG